MVRGRLALLGGLMAASIALHQIAFGLAGGGLIEAHGYLATVVPLLVGTALALALTSLLLPLFDGSGARRDQPVSPFPVAAALAAIFVVQELAEALVGGTGVAGLEASAAAAWILPPLVLVAASLVSWAALMIGRAGERLALVVRLRPPGRAPRPRSAAAPALADFDAASSPLAFGLARRPPPAGSSPS